MTTQQIQPKRGIVKQVLSGDSVIIRGSVGAPPPEKQLNFSNIIAPKLARRATETSEVTKDEPFAWEAREFLRKKLVGEEVWFTAEKPPNAAREYGVVYLGKDFNTAENITKSLISEGLVNVRRDGVRMTPELEELCEKRERC
ncbi:ebna2 binding protein [Holotrichia oblita]|uniref:Ebna2 binding protein n=1 Tax=Holotrichia oblita TaxID=644536 RepID=A0ACB9TVG3_HOLOL|nr:ebna2 binding protein [Holotrichia oblita]